MTNIFENLEEKKTIFKNKKPLDHRFLPEHLPHRSEQITGIAKYWIEALNNNTPSDVTIYGKTGTGKTAAAKFAKEQLIEASANKDLTDKKESTEKPEKKKEKKSKNRKKDAGTDITIIDLDSEEIDNDK